MVRQAENIMEQEESTRQKKVARQIQKDLSEIIRLQGMGAWQGALITVTRVRMSPDLSLAKVWLSVFPSDKADFCLSQAEGQARTLRGELGRRVARQLRIVPELAFFRDDSLDYVQHIDDLLNS